MELRYRYWFIKLCIGVVDRGEAYNTGYIRSYRYLEIVVLSDILLGLIICA